ncbi:tripartite tricarboxylate transporter TctB family protein [Ancylobacter polymorphus]|uniref:Tripartite tricarboxylate transporter TctB family protein n=1 Tax=Ancylobacter polymorphus TaxID=223390 RepID=A0A9E7A9L5_9HYPH|nr:tripartite tricarboxylate transporter TctB family protein [Ancylobacter polymorphus]UOK73324.1 tripartite tricarboxylate transporter TctB family protein [Ancylobacter polymorphus]
MRKSWISKDTVAGCVFISSGLTFAYVSYTQLTIGAALDMGPGYFPFAVALFLAALGLIVVVRGLLAAVDPQKLIIPWRGIVMISLSILVFALTLYPLGLFLSVVLSALIASLSRPGVGLVKSVVIGLGIGLFCTILFGKLLGLPIPVLGTFLS